jgi:V8-like Glu-specific endopeptidase
VCGYLQKDKVYVDKKRDLGPLAHDCWTYWGHSGAPLINKQGEVVGMHNSWNPKNAMRHAMSLLSLMKFREICITKGFVF